MVFPWQIRHQQPDPNALVADLLRFGLAENTLEKSINELRAGKAARFVDSQSAVLPQVLLLDEITSALDESNKKKRE